PASRSRTPRVHDTSSVTPFGPPPSSVTWVARAPLARSGKPQRLARGEDVGGGAGGIAVDERVARAQERVHDRHAVAGRRLPCAAAGGLAGGDLVVRHAIVRCELVAFLGRALAGGSPLHHDVLRLA